MTALTPVQRRALEWLPSDGSWTEDRPGRQLAPALKALRRVGFVLTARMTADTFGYRLTPAGVARAREIRGEG